MKFLFFLSAAIYTVAILAAPGAISLNRSFRTILSRAEGDDLVQIACVECPCTGWNGGCQCVNNGCCCDQEVPGQPPEDGWRKAQ